MKSNNLDFCDVKLFIKLKRRRDNKKKRDCGIWLLGILERDIFPTKGVHGDGEEERERKKRKNGRTWFVKILRRPHCFVYVCVCVYRSLFTHKSFTVLSHFAACRSRDATCVIGKCPCHFYEPARFFPPLKKVLNHRPFDARSSLIVTRPHETLLASPDNSKLLLKPRRATVANRFCPKYRN